MKNKKYLFPFLFLLLAVFGHSFYIYRFLKDGTIFTGPNDGLEQMLPFQLFLYDKWSHGQFFYDMDFGLGGDYYTDLAYYYSTSVVFYVNMVAVWWLNLFFHFKTESIQFWAVNAFYISIFKSAVAMYFTYLYFTYLKVDRISALLGAFLFLTSAIYFRFTLYWSFFSDVFIFLPLLLLGIEKYIQDKKKSWFITAVALSLINNFYFAYYQMLFGVIYFIIRMIFRSERDRATRLDQWKAFLTMTLLGTGISMFSFFYGVKGFLQNDRAPYTDPMTLFNTFDQHANIFYDNYLVIVLYITLQALFTFKFYRSYFYRFFALMTIALIYLSFMPFIDSVFNGFSAPQKRWHYLLTFFSSGLIAMYIARFRHISVQNYLYSLLPGFIIVGLSYIYIDKKVEWVWYLPGIALIGLCILLVKNKRAQQVLYVAQIAALMLFNWHVVKEHNVYDNYNPGIDSRAKMSYIESSVYNSGLQQEIINDLKARLKPGERIDWRVLEQDNTPLYQRFPGVSLYSSIFDGSLIDFYYHQLKINLKEESISRYSTFQSRSNLESLFNVRYLVRKDYQTDIPENFKLIETKGKYNIYENILPLPVAKVTDTLFDADTLKTPIDREHAMLKGVVLNGESTASISPAENLLSSSTIQASGATWQTYNQTLSVNPPNGGVIITLPKDALKKYKDFYVELHAELTSAESNIQINVNGYANNRLFKSSKYRTHQDDLLYRVKPKNGKILIGMTQGTYRFNIQGIYGEDYQALEKAERTNEIAFTEDGHHMQAVLKEHRAGYLVTPIIYRDGLTARIDGKKAPVERGNYLQAVVKVPADARVVEFKYIPPYFYLTVLISMLSLIAALFYLKPVQRKRKP
ncbi:YfhO family protein [Macrococcus bovicus]|uniref:YfhO family protein n=1 Tax=Macrococcus bovicus TaxID=69968 RepID=UPI0025A68CAC|nr:YfhO family protein [Macrococcus bovicus]WJP98669.1 YfhO family protein [Macrococcus bovicus]